MNSRSSQAYVGLDFTRQELGAAMRETYDELITFVTSEPFQAIHAELMNLSKQERPGFVLRVLLRKEELVKRGVQVPGGILIQTSAFGDRRPTLFVVKKFLPPRFHQVWQNVNITFDNEFDDAEVSRDPEACWRAPLPVALQNAAIAAGIDLESLPSQCGLSGSKPPSKTTQSA